MKKAGNWNTWPGSSQVLYRQAEIMGAIVSPSPEKPGRVQDCYADGIVQRRVM